MKYNIYQKCLEAKKKEAYYGAKLNKEIKDVYLGVGILEPGEVNKKIGPGRGHEEILYVSKGKIGVKLKDAEHVLEQGELICLLNSQKARVSNLSDDASEFTIAGGHTKPHKH